MSKAGILFIMGIAIILALSSCAHRQYMPPISVVKPDSLLHISDEEIKEAFNMQPQLIKPLTLAIYNASVDETPLINSLEALDGINSIFEISP